VHVRGLDYCGAIVLSPAPSAVEAANNAPAEKEGVPGRRVARQAATNRFSARVELRVRASGQQGRMGPADRRCDTGDTLYELNSDKILVPASNMKLFTTLPGAANSGRTIVFTPPWRPMRDRSRWHAFRRSFLFGRGDPLSSNRKFPSDLKEESTAIQRECFPILPCLVAKWRQKNPSNVIGGGPTPERQLISPHRFRRLGIGDCLGIWRGHFVHVIDDNTVALSIDPGRNCGRLGASRNYARDRARFLCLNDVLTSAAEVNSGPQAQREPGSHCFVVSGALPAKSLHAQCSSRDSRAGPARRDLG